MKLQANNAGAWKQVMVFSVEHLDRVKAAAAELAEISAWAESGVAWRILDGQETVVLQFDMARGWHLPHWMAGREMVP